MSEAGEREKGLRETVEEMSTAHTELEAELASARELSKQQVRGGEGGVRGWRVGEGVEGGMRGGGLDCLILRPSLLPSFPPHCMCACGQNRCE